MLVKKDPVIIGLAYFWNREKFFRNLGNMGNWVLGENVRYVAPSIDLINIQFLDVLLFILFIINWFK